MPREIVPSMPARLPYCCAYSLDPNSRVQELVPCPRSTRHGSYYPTCYGERKSCTLYDALSTCRARARRRISQPGLVWSENGLAEATLP